MAFFSPIEAVRVALVRSDVRDAVLATMNDFEAKTGRKLFVPADGGFRTESDQTRIYADSLAQGFRAAPPGKSPHQLAAAIDLQLVGTTQDAERDQRDPLYRQLAEIATSHGLRAGFYFKTGKPDPYHFEAAETDDVMRAQWDAKKKHLSTLLSSRSSLSSSSPWA